MELVHLQSFLAVYRTGTVTRAAQELHLSQPAVTAHVRSLEAELKRPLFVRLPRGVSPTPLADRLAREITSPLDSLTATATGFRPDADLSTATLLLGGPADVLAEVILPLLGPLVDQGLSIRVRTGLTAELVAALGIGELDLVIATTPTRHPSITLSPLFEEVLALTASPRLATRLSRTTELSSIALSTWPSLLVDHPLVAFAENAPLVRRYWRSVFGLGTPPAPRVVFDDLRAISRSVASMSAWTVLPTYLVDQEVERGELVFLTQPPTPPTNTLYLATRPAKTRQGPTTRVVEYLQSFIER
jgi:DNA-binding transcriptional LysR family regulator